MFISSFCFTVIERGIIPFSSFVYGEVCILSMYDDFTYRLSFERNPIIPRNISYPFINTGDQAERQKTSTNLANQIRITERN